MTTWRIAVPGGERVIDIPEGGEPGPHTHAVSDSTGLQAALDGKAASGHSHPVADVSGLQSTLDGKAASSHTHAQADVTGLTSALAAKEATANKGVANGYAGLDALGLVPLAQLPGGLPPALHASTHQHSGLDEVATATAGANAIPKAGSGGTLAIGWIPTGTSSTTVCVGNDARLSDARTPTTHGIIASHNGFPGGTSTFLRADGSFAAPTATAADLNLPETGALTVATGKYHLTGVRHQATGSQRITVAGTGRLRIQN